MNEKGKGKTMNGGIRRRRAGRMPALLFSLLLLFTPTHVFPAELKIQDHIGLVRGIQHIQRLAKVLVNISPQQDFITELHLAHLDGLASDIPGIQNGNTFEFPGVTPGTWKIQSTNPDINITDVKIIEH